MRQFMVYAPAKLNLYLDVLEKRRDGYHTIETLFEKIDLKDEILIKEKASGVEVRVEPLNSCSSGKQNIAYKAIQTLFEARNVKIGLDVVIKKKVPVSAGLGGGSSDAASVLRGLNEQLELGLSPERLFSIAVQIGKDVPFFMLDKAFAIGKGAGEILEPVNVDANFHHIVLKPNIALSTTEMYKRIDGSGVRARKSGIAKMISFLEQNDLASLEKGYYNSFEDVLGSDAREIKKAKDLLANAAAAPGFLSGSGPSVFCTFKSMGEARDALKRIPKERDIDIFLATTYKGGIYGDNRS
ncbi:MAG: 4-(cytidine 5'-diphospho)-2-C-methyl-D-erythritol kinase [Candidatus Omnitrophica bacterium]|nr:4-(cytidine 5'-diphospho)-2-C-methyl-D-erythritol kinase [Candidatus Omnitrophota bacterium]